MTRREPGVFRPDLEAGVDREDVAFITRREEVDGAMKDVMCLCRRHADDPCDDYKAVAIAEDVIEFSTGRHESYFDAEMETAEKLIAEHMPPITVQGGRT